jgi:hypothetical protein
LATPASDADGAADFEAALARPCTSSLAPDAADAVGSALAVTWAAAAGEADRGVSLAAVEAGVLPALSVATLGGGGSGPSGPATVRRFARSDSVEPTVALSRDGRRVGSEGGGNGPDVRPD